MELLNDNKELMGIKKWYFSAKIVNWEVCGLLPVILSPFNYFWNTLEKAEEPEIKLPTSSGSSKKQEVSEKHLFLLYWLCQSLWLCGPQETMENSEREGNVRPWPASLGTCMQERKQELELDTEKQTGSK